MSTGFISEKSLDEIKRKRQEEWEKVRKPEDPKEAPEEQYDPRSLYDRLKEQKDKKQAEWDEAHKFKNMIRGLDDDEAGFLDFVDKAKSEQELKVLQEEKQEMEEYRKAVAEAEEQKLTLALKPNASSLLKPTNSLPSAISGMAKDNQRTKLSGLVRKRKASDTLPTVSPPKAPHTGVSTDQVPSAKNSLECVAILPGIGCYSDSDSDDSSSSESNNFSMVKSKNQLDLCGRPVHTQDDDE